MKGINCKLTFILLFFFTMTMNISAQNQTPVWSKLASLPDSLGFAGMFAGAINDNVFCMGGANFPEGKPWEGGSKCWYDGVFMLKNGRWAQLKEKLPFPLAYGVSISCKDKIILIGGSNPTSHSNKVLACTMKNKKLKIESYPDLPFPLANMSGSIINNLIIISGGSTSPGSEPLKKCLGLNLNDLNAGWFEMEPWPGPERIFPISATYNGKYYLFSGETTALNNNGQKQRFILQDAYCYTPAESSGKWNGTWEKLPDMPKGISAGPSPAPFIKSFGFVFWGGVDRVTALYKDPATHPGIAKEVVSFNPVDNSWNYLQKNEDIPSRVTLPVVFLKDKWIYISGEIKPGIRTNTVYSIQ